MKFEDNSKHITINLATYVSTLFLHSFSKYNFGKVDMLKCPQSFPKGEKCHSNITSSYKFENNLEHSYQKRNGGP
jgi:hypothetical protein